MERRNAPRRTWTRAGYLAGIEREPIGRRRVVPLRDDQETEWRILDTFDGAIAGAGGLLVTLADQLRLLRGETDVIQQFAGSPGFVADLDEGPVKDELTRLVPPLRRLLVLGGGRATLGAFKLVDDLDKTHARLELALLVSPDGPPVTLASIEGLRGYDGSFDDLAARIEAADGSEAIPVGKVHARLAPGHVPYESKPAIKIAPDEPAFRAATDLIRINLEVARRNEDGAIADLDTEFLHDYRIALRKIRSVVSLFSGVFSDEQTRVLKDRFAALMAPTARLRDLDVYLLERRTYLDMVPASLQPGLEQMFDAFVRERKDEHARLSKHLRSAAYRREMDALVALFDGGDGPAAGPMAEQAALGYACNLIWRRYRKVCKIARSIDDATPDARVHQLRIHCKKLRYLLEFFGPLFEGRAAPLVKALKKLQDNLGAFNDYSVQQQALDAYLASLATGRGSGKLQIAKSVGALIAVLHQGQMAERARIAESFARFDSQKTREGFENLFHVLEGSS